MLLKDEVQILRRLPLFASVDPSKLKLLAFTSDRLHYAPGNILFHQGDFGDAAYVILSGVADVLIETPEGLYKIAEVKDDSIVGEIAILCDVARTATVSAQSDLDVLRISKENFIKLLKDFPQMAIEIMRELASRVSRTTEELTEARALVHRYKAAAGEVQG